MTTEPRPKLRAELLDHDGWRAACAKLWLNGVTFETIADGFALGSNHTPAQKAAVVIDAVDGFIRDYAPETLSLTFPDACVWQARTALDRYAKAKGITEISAVTH